MDKDHGQDQRAVKRQGPDYRGWNGLQDH